MSYQVTTPHTWTAVLLLIVVSLVGLSALSFPSTAQAKTVSASDTYWGELYYRATADSWWDVWVRGLANPHATVHYHADARNVSTGAALADGANVAVGTVVQFTPRLGHISWVGTGRTMDTPTGSWIPNAGLGESTWSFRYSSRNYQRGLCQPKNYVGSYKNLSRGNYDPWYPVHIPFSVNPPAQSVNVTGTAGLTALGGNRYRVDSPGTITAEVNFSNTFGRYYYQYSSPRRGCTMSWGAAPMLNGNLLSAYGRYEDYSHTKHVRNYGSLIYNARFAARTITYNLTATGAPEPSNAAPSDPSINGAAEVAVGTTYPFDFVSTDADGDDLYYEIDWNQDGTADQRVPNSGLVSEGVSQSWSRTWSTAVNRSFAVRAVDASGAASGWSDWNVAVNAPGAALSFETAVNDGVWSASDQTVSESDTVDLRWSTTNMTNCTGTNFSTGGATNNTGLTVSTPSPGTTETYTLDCTTSAGDTQIASLNITTATVPLPTVTVRSRVDGGPWLSGNQTVNPGQTVEMEWSSTNAASCTGINVPGLSGTSGDTSVTEPATGDTDTYGATCFNSAGDPASDTFTVTTLAPSACSDGTDNDGDGFTDHPDDPGCTGPNDDNEGPLHCSDTSADNYQAAASCEYSGCTDSSATNYDPDATTDDGSCVFQPTVSLEAQIKPVNPGDDTYNGSVSITPTDELELSWSSTEASSCTTNFGGSSNPSDTTDVTPTLDPGDNTTYNVTCTGPGGDGTDSLDVSVPGIAATFEANPAVVRPGETTTLEWDLGLSDSLSATPGGDTAPYDYTCTIQGATVDDDPHTFNAADNGGVGSVTTRPINSRFVSTLSCGAAVNVETDIDVVPSSQEI